MVFTDPEPDGPTPQGSAAPGVRPAGRNLPVAIASGVTLAVLFIGSLVFSHLAFLGFWTILMLLGLAELDKAFRLEGWRPATPVVMGAGIVMTFGAYLAGPSAQTFGMVLVLIGGMAWALIDRDRTAVAGSLGATALMALWLPLLGSFIGLLLDRPNGEWAVMAAVALTVTADISAYAFGSAFGRRKMAPSVSPAKTWEGFAGGLLTAVVLAAVVTARVPGFDLASAVILGVGVALAGTIGDLGESMIKRDLGVKDLGGILPGHGGVMERADAVIFALPVAYLLVEAFAP